MLMRLKVLAKIEQVEHQHRRRERPPSPRPPTDARKPRKPERVLQASSGIGVFTASATR